MYSNNILNNFKCPYEKSLETYRMHFEPLRKKKKIKSIRLLVLSTVIKNRI